MGGLPGAIDPGAQCVLTTGHGIINGCRPVSLCLALQIQAEPMAYKVCC